MHLSEGLGTPYEYSVDCELHMVNCSTGKREGRQALCSRKRCRVCDGVRNIPRSQMHSQRTAPECTHITGHKQTPRTIPPCFSPAKSQQISQATRSTKSFVVLETVLRSHRESILDGIVWRSRVNQTHCIVHICTSPVPTLDIWQAQEEINRNSWGSKRIVQVGDVSSRFSLYSGHKSLFGGFAQRTAQ